MDLTKIEKPFGLLDKETQEALKAHGGLVERFDGYRWIETKNPIWHSVYVYRVKPEPPKPREWWLVGECEAWDDKFAAERSAKMLHVQSPIIHVREVLE